MATYYWTNYGEMPGQWEHQANWSLSEGGSPAPSYPGYGDTVIIPNGYGEITSLSTAPEMTTQYVTIAKLIVNSSYGINPGYDPDTGYSIYMYITCDTAIFQGSTGPRYNVTFYADCELSGYWCSNDGTINGSATFSGDGSRNSGYISGWNPGDIATFSGSGSYNQSYIGGHATFSGYQSRNSGYQNSGDVLFSGSGSYNDTGGNIYGYTLFKNGAYNLGSIYAECRFEGDGCYNQGSVGPSWSNNCYFAYNTENAIGGTVTGIATFAGEVSRNKGTVNGVAVFSGTGSSNTGTVNGALLAFTPNVNITGTRYPLDVLGAGI